MNCLEPGGDCGGDGDKPYRLPPLAVGDTEQTADDECLLPLTSHAAEEKAFLALQRFLFQELQPLSTSRRGHLPAVTPFSAPVN